jgi:hypothetical protein
MTETLNDHAHGANDQEPIDERPGINRRRMFVVGAGLAGAAALAKASPAAAADDDPVLVGNPDNVTDDGATVVTNSNNTATDPGTEGQEAITALLTGVDNGSTAIRGAHDGAGAGVGGASADGYGAEFVGGKAAARLVPSAGVAVGAPADDMHLVGELFVDGNGDLYYNTADGANFTKLNGQGGVVMLPDAQRAYDSREEFPLPANTNKGRFDVRETREIDLGEFTDIPASATGAIINLTIDVVDTHGFATVFNGETADADRPNASAINWGPNTVTIANGIIVSVGSTNTIKVYTLEPCEVIIDVAGYVS